MLYKVFPDEQFAEASMNIAKTLAQMPTRGLAFTKKALEWSTRNTLDEQLVDEDTLQQRAATTKDFKEGVAAFMEKRTPNFKGE
jgi:2-(1,2-epoxy-1,2-dihydrophenyl)acetyl-CoA isomerase